MPDYVPAHIQAWLDHALPQIQADARLLGVAAGGSWLRGELDEWSDLDLVLAVADDAHAAVMDDRAAIAGRWGTLVAHFTGEHVGDPRLLICLYDDPLVHVDLKFVTTTELRDRVEDPDVIWERDGAFTEGMRASDASWPMREPQWIEDRFWTWIHYAAAKLGRGELFETLSALDFLRGHVLIPLAMQRARHNPQGARRVEQRLPADARSQLAATIAPLEAPACGAALQAAATCYESWRAPCAFHTHAQRVVLAYLDAVRARL